MKRDAIFTREYGSTPPELALARAIKEAGLCQAYKSIEVRDALRASNPGDTTDRVEFEYEGKKVKISRFPLTFTIHSPTDRFLTSSLLDLLDTNVSRFYSTRHSLERRILLWD